MKLRSRRRRRVTAAFKKAGIWIFLAVFIASTVGIVLITAAVR
ncbi:MAG: hypothetical protein ACREM2_10055 [Vulcanimicrobiaceae bacterium]